jgi:small subunit ribosomal protein S6
MTNIIKRHYEIVLLIHPDRSEQAETMLQRYRDMIAADTGTIHRFEDWGRRQLAYPINKIRKAHYVLMNIECTLAVVEELKSLFRYNDAIIRSLVLKRDAAITAPSPMMTVAKPAGRHEDRDRRRSGERHERRDER